MINKSLNNIDILKVILAILVIGIHTSPFSFNGWLDKGFGLMTCLAVPTFFIISGFFLNDKMSRDNEALFGKSCVKFIKIALLWSILYIPFWTKEMLSFCDKVKAVVYYSLNHHLWYLWGSALATFLMFLLVQKLHLKRGCIDFISIFLFALGVMLSTYSPLISFLDGPLNTRNGLFYGFPLMWLGYRCFELRTILSSKHVFSLGITSFVCLGFEAIFCTLILHSESRIMWFFQPLCAACLFIVALQSRNLNLPITGNVIRRLSLLMYTSHYMFIYVFNWLGVYDGVLLFVCVTILTVISSMILLKGRGFFENAFERNKT